MIAVRGVLLDGRYRLGERIGSGGMGQVWSAVDERMDRPVAVKLLSTAVDAGDPVLVARFEREARAAGRISSPYVVTVHDYGEAELDGRPTLYLVMERLQGRTLGAVLAGGRPRPAQAVTWGMQICEAMAAAHRAGLVHRDIKPANVMVTPEGTVKVLDFGIARFVEETAALTTLTETGHAVGTPAYMSPEQARGSRAIGAASDLYSFGCLLYALLCGEPPFSGVPLVLMRQHLETVPDPPSRRRPGLSRHLDRLVLDLLRKDPGQRPGSAGEVTRRLRLASGGGGEGDKGSGSDSGGGGDGPVPKAPRPAESSRAPGGGGPAYGAPGGGVPAHGAPDAGRPARGAPALPPRRWTPAPPPGSRAPFLRGASSSPPERRAPLHRRSSASPPAGGSPTPPPAGGSPAPAPDGRSAASPPAGGSPVPPPGRRSPAPSPGGRSSASAPGGRSSASAPGGRSSASPPDRRSSASPPARRSPGPYGSSDPPPVRRSSDPPFSPVPPSPSSASPPPWFPPPSYGGVRPAAPYFPWRPPEPVPLPDPVFVGPSRAAPSTRRKDSRPVALAGLLTGMVTGWLLDAMTTWSLTAVVVIACLVPAVVMPLAVLVGQGYDGLGPKKTAGAAAMLCATAFVSGFALLTPLVWWRGTLVGLGVALGCALLVALSSEYFNDNVSRLASYAVPAAGLTTGSVCFATVFTAGGRGGAAWWWGTLWGLVVFTAVQVVLAVLIRATDD
ncbi:serine/threonine-protein kinase [Streptomyces albireticuli]|uniref:serine/threonine-protein kinase n=1 Tax=Streptomyces albireticuli TaxID=1940 RepID=UPI001474F443|nr:serine/threonine-protein kinase [Streptomyces albireticuli]MCD9142928.1 protein kinase [Streptomyces albireticuli]MCD9162753.1 protein kinase [Streptomyces albireticuli]MCD9192313.1 protein kinase [Streptomyces albireticuli]